MPQSRKNSRKKQPSAEGKIFQYKEHSAIRTDFLITLPYHGLDQTIRYRTDEFSAVCPFSGLPDTGTVIIEYIPRKLIIELKSLKYYFISYRNVGIYQEDATNRMFHDIYRLLKPKHMKITTAYNTRGGIDSTCSIEKGNR